MAAILHAVFVKSPRVLLGIIRIIISVSSKLCEYGLDTLAEQINSTNELLKTVFIRILYNSSPVAFPSPKPYRVSSLQTACMG